MSGRAVPECLTEGGLSPTLNVRDTVHGCSPRLSDKEKVHEALVFMTLLPDSGPDVTSSLMPPQPWTLSVQYFPVMTDCILKPGA